MFSPDALKVLSTTVCYIHYEVKSVLRVWGTSEWHFVLFDEVKT